MTYDQSVITVKVDVKDVGGRLTATLTQDSEPIAFTNAYNAAGEIVLEGTKTMVGRDLEADEFEFQLKDAENKVVATAKNTADGKIVFGTLEYGTDDIGKTYTYTATELQGNLAGVTYDTNSFTVTVQITDNGDGTLKVKKTTDSQNIAFTNTYGAAGSVTFAGTKSLKGRDLTADDEFTFAILEGETVVGTAKSDATGKIAYPTLTYTVADIGPTPTR